MLDGQIWYPLKWGTRKSAKNKWILECQIFAIITFQISEISPLVSLSLLSPILFIQNLSQAIHKSKVETTDSALPM